MNLAAFPKIQKKYFARFDLLKIWFILSADGGWKKMAPEAASARLSLGFEF
jgi:hypothetical protein